MSRSGKALNEGPATGNQGRYESIQEGGLLFGAQLLAVDHVNLSLDKHKPSILSIVGESGSGKTTLAKIILKMYEPTLGDVLLQGKSVFGRHPDLDTLAYYQAVQPIFQNPFETFSMRKYVDSYLYDTALNLTKSRTRKSHDLVCIAHKSLARSFVPGILTKTGPYPYVLTFKMEETILSPLGALMSALSHVS